jgi:hypothetical protein
MEPSNLRRAKPSQKISSFAASCVNTTQQLSDTTELIKAEVPIIQLDDGTREHVHGDHRARQPSNVAGLYSTFVGGQECTHR